MAGGQFKAVLFDFTGVITNSPFAGIDAAAVDHGWTPAAFRELIAGTGAADDDHPFQEMILGKISLSEYYLDLMDRLSDAGIKIDITEMIRGLTDIVVNEGIPERIEQIRAEGFHTGLVTNTVREAEGLWRSLVDMDGLFEVVVTSYEAGTRKPDRAIWEIAFEKLGVTAEQTVMLEGEAIFWPAIRDIGMHLIAVVDPYEGMDELDALLGRAG